MLLSICAAYAVIISAEDKYCIFFFCKIEKVTCKQYNTFIVNIVIALFDCVITAMFLFCMSAVSLKRTKHQCPDL